MRAPILIGAMLALCAGLGVYATRSMDAKDQEQMTQMDRFLAPERKAFREHQDETMRGELSPLARVDYLHLPAGEHRLGEAELQLPATSPYAGEVRFKVRPGGLSLDAAPGVPVNGTPRERADLKGGDVIGLGALRLLVAGLPDDPSLAVYDTEAPARRAFQGLRYYPADSHYTTVGKLVRYERPAAVTVEASRGGPQRMQAIGEVRFELMRQSLSLEAYDRDPQTLFLIFKDETNGKADGTYGAGRFLYARIAPGDQVVLDFNQAWNPLCAYSHFFHCPLPPRRNWLKLAIPVGEKVYAAH